MTQNQLTDIFALKNMDWTIGHLDYFLENVLDQFFGPIFLDYFLVHS